MDTQDIHLLMIEDNPRDVTLLKQILIEQNDHSFTVTSIARLQTALAYLAQNQVDVILLDLCLPDSQGLDTFVNVGRQAPTIPIVILSGMDDEKTALQVVQAGAQDYLVKGQFNVDLLTRTIRYAIERKRVEEALRESEARYRGVVEDQSELICRFRPNGRLIFANEAFRRFFEHTDAQLTTGGLAPFSSNGKQKDFARRISALDEENPVETLEGGFVLASEETRWLQWTLRGIFDTQGDLAEIQAVGRDVTERKMAAEHLQYTAFHDALTGLPNQNLFMRQLQQSSQNTEPGQDTLFAVLFLDLDRFKLVNDSLGHYFGDRLLTIVAGRLKACVRASDMVARFGGDEFVILLQNIQNVHDAVRIANRIQTQLALPVTLKGQKIFTTASIGIALGRSTTRCPAELLRNADIAMYQAKGLGKARYEIFDASMHTQVAERWQLETDLHAAVERQEFRLFYQPIFSLTTGQITRVEALLRWQHPQRGLLAPAEFLLTAEETGLISTIGKQVLWSACARAKAWQAIGYPHLQVAVNVSPRQFQDTNIIALVLETLQATELPARVLNLEITESVALKNHDVQILEKLNALGVGISLDDFGLGSSLDCLKRLPLNTLKIDQSFVRDMGAQTDDRAIIATIISLAHKLGLKVVAEGVEQEEHLSFLRSEDCDEVQGHLLSHPLPAGELVQLLEELHLTKSVLSTASV